jgi:hypothetical protein
MMMNEIMTAPGPADPAEAAFARMQGEVALLRRAIEAMAAERAEAPDYSETLGMIAARVEAIRKTVKGILEQPALGLTPEVMAARIRAAADQVRQADRAALTEAQKRLEQAAGQVREAAGTVLAVQGQRRRLAVAGLGGALAGAILWAILPGAVARLAPESWRWPEALAARTLGLGRAEAGERLLATADPQGWQTLEVARRLADDNAPVIAACAMAAGKAGKPVRCQVMVGPETSLTPR